MFSEWNFQLASSKFTQINSDNLQFFDLDWRVFFIFILFHIFIKRTYISLKEFSLVFFLSFLFAYTSTLLGQVSDWLVTDLSNFQKTELAILEVSNIGSGLSLSS